MTAFGLPQCIRRTPVLLVVSLVALMVIPTATALAASSGKTSGGGFSKPPPLTYRPDASPATSRLVQTLTQVGAVIDGTEIGWCTVSDTSSSGLQRGLFATKNFKTDQVICKIPSAYVLALSDPESDKEVTMAQLGANFLTMYHQHDTAAAQWAFYLDSLPQRLRYHETDNEPNDAVVLERTPNCYSTDDLALLEFPRSIHMARERHADIDRVLLQHGAIKRETLQWATTLVSSRSFGLAMAPPSDESADVSFDDRGQVITAAGERQTVRVLIPYLDMVNHASLPKANCQWTVLDPHLDNAWLALTASRPIRAGTELTRSYEAASALSAVELLNDYGMVEAGNPMDSYMLRKGGDDTLQRNDWSTTLDEDETMLRALGTESNVETDTLRTILQFRIQLKKSDQS